jgi:hypothetical protein
METPIPVGAVATTQEVSAVAPAVVVSPVEVVAFQVVVVVVAVVVAEVVEGEDINPLSADNLHLLL